MYTLYYATGTCSFAVHAILNELGVDFEVKKIDLKAPRPEEFLKINPRGSVPVLVDDGHVIREGAAIMVYLLDKHKSALLPQTGYERGEALEWLMFANATVHPAYSRVLYAKKNFSENATQQMFTKPTLESLRKIWEEIEAHLADKTYLAGDKLTAGDILLAVFANWNGMLPEPILFGPNTKRFLKDVTSQPFYQKTLKDEEMEYRAAA